jgi:hypothetical protein
VELLLTDISDPSNHQVELKLTDKWSCFSRLKPGGGNSARTGSLSPLAVRLLLNLLAQWLTDHGWIARQHLVLRQSNYPRSIRILTACFC